MMTIVYNLIYLVALTIYLPYVIIKKKWHKDFGSRLGFLRSSTIQKISGKKNIWIHAVSVGEVIAVIDLVKELQRQHPDYHIVISTVTVTGNTIAKQALTEGTVIFAPLDFSWIVKKYIRLIRPLMYISAETEIWPNLYTQLNKQSIPIVQVNGRISDKAFKGYKRYAFLFANALKSVTVFCMQSQIDADRIVNLGAPIERIRIVGNLKFDSLLNDEGIQKETLGFSSEDMIFTAGSTHPGEEKIVIDAYQELLKEYPQLKLILVPRHIERASEIEDLLKKNNIQSVRFSKLFSRPAENSTIVVDVVGKLRHLYAISDVVFIGKTFLVGGGQNMIEPLSFGKPTFVGPLTQNFKSVMEILKSERIITVLDEPTELSKTMKPYLEDAKKRQEFSLKAKEVIQKYRGAQEKTLNEIEEILVNT